MLRRNGIRQPQVRNWSPEIQPAEGQHCQVRQEQPGGRAELRPGGDEPAVFIATRPFHRQQDRAAPFAADPNPLDQPQQGQNDRAPNADYLITGNQTDRSGGNAGHQQGHDQGRFAADAVAVMAEDRGADRARDETDEIDGESFEHPDQRVGFGKEQLGEDEAGDNAV